MVAGRRIGQVIRRHVHGLDRRDRAGLGRRDAFLELPHLLGQRRLVAHRRRHPSEQRRHFGAGQRVAVDVVDEEQDVLAFVTERFGHRQACQADTQAVARGFVHLPEHHRDLVEDVRVLHLVIEVVALARALADAREHRVAAVGLRDVVDEFHHRHGLADASAAEETDLAALGKRADQVDDLDAGFEQFDRRRQFIELRRRLVDRAPLVRLDRAGFVDRPAEHVHDAAERTRADRHHDAGAGVLRLHAAPQAVGRAHRDRAHDAVAELLLHLESQPLLDQRVGRIRLKNERVVNLRHVVARELDVHDCANALNDGSGGSGAHRISSVLLFNSVSITKPRRRRRRFQKFLW